MPSNPPNYHKNKDQELRDIVAFRESMGLAPIRSGDRECLKCEKTFFSDDLVNMKCCMSCRLDMKHPNDIKKTKI